MIAPSQSSSSFFAASFEWGCDARVSGSADLFTSRGVPLIYLPPRPAEASARRGDQNGFFHPTKICLTLTLRPEPPQLVCFEVDSVCPNPPVHPFHGIRARWHTFSSIARQPGGDNASGFRRRVPIAFHRFGCVCWPSVLPDLDRQDTRGGRITRLFAGDARASAMERV